MTRITAEDYLPHARVAEGSVPWMYLDTVGIVTVGIGHAMTHAADACLLPFNIGGRLATTEEIAADFAAVQAMPKGQIAANYKSRTQCRLDQDAIAGVYAADFDAKLPELAKRISGFDAFPQPVQLALADMGFNLGVQGLLTKFPKLMRAVGSRDWKTCALECRRPQLSAARNLQTARWFKDAISVPAAIPQAAPPEPPALALPSALSASPGPANDSRPSESEPIAVGRAPEPPTPAPVEQPRPWWRSKRIGAGATLAGGSQVPGWIDSLWQSASDWFKNDPDAVHVL